MPQPNRSAAVVPLPGGGDGEGVGRVGVGLGGIGVGVGVGGIRDGVGNGIDGGVGSGMDGIGGMDGMSGVDGIGGIEGIGTVGPAGRAEVDPDPVPGVVMEGAVGTLGVVTRPAPVEPMIGPGVGPTIGNLARPVGEGDAAATGGRGGSVIPGRAIPGSVIPGRVILGSVGTNGATSVAGAVVTPRPAGAVPGCRVAGSGPGLPRTEPSNVTVAISMWLLRRQPQRARKRSIISPTLSDADRRVRQITSAAPSEN